jgi:hypothetical protein
MMGMMTAVAAGEVSDLAGALVLAFVVWFIWSLLE